VRATVIDIAREASVSAATVDRVLNNRSGVRQRTREIVLEAAQRVGYLPEAADGPLARKTETNALIRLDFVLPAGTNNVVRQLIDAGKSWGVYFEQPQTETNVFQYLPEVAGNPAQLVARLDAQLLHSTMSSAMKNAIVTAVSVIPATDMLSRARTAAYLVTTSSQYQVQR